MAKTTCVSYDRLCLKPTYNSNFVFTLCQNMGLKHNGSLSSMHSMPWVPFVILILLRLYQSFHLYCVMRLQMHIPAQSQKSLMQICFQDYTETLIFHLCVNCQLLFKFQSITPTFLMCVFNLTVKALVCLSPSFFN